MQVISSAFWMENDAVTSHYVIEKCSVDFFHMRVIRSADSGKVLNPSSGLWHKTLECIVLIVSSYSNSLSLLLLLVVVENIISSSVICLACSFILSH